MPIEVGARKNEAMTIDDAYRTLGITRGAPQADAFAAYQEQSARLASESEQVVAELNRAYEVVTQDIWRQAQPPVDVVPSDDADEVETPTPPEPWEAVGQRPPSRRRVVLLTLGLVAAALATVFVVAPMLGQQAGPTTDEEEDAGWTEEFKANVIGGCAVVSGGQEAACRCVVEDLSARMSEDEYLRLNYDLATTGRMPRDLVHIMNYCVGNT